MKRIVLVLSLAFAAPVFAQNKNFAERYLEIRSNAEEEKIQVKTLSGKEFASSVRDSLDWSKLTDDERKLLESTLQKVDRAVVGFDGESPSTGTDDAKALFRLLNDYEDLMSVTNSNLNIRYLAGGVDDKKNTFTEMSAFYHIGNISEFLFGTMFQNLPEEIVRSDGDTIHPNFSFSGSMSTNFGGQSIEVEGSNVAIFMSLCFKKPVTEDECLALIKITTEEDDDEDADNEETEIEEAEEDEDEIEEPIVDSFFSTPTVKRFFKNADNTLTQQTQALADNPASLVFEIKENISNGALAMRKTTDDRYDISEIVNGKVQDKHVHEITVAATNQTILNLYSLAFGKSDDHILYDPDLKYIATRSEPFKNHAYDISFKGSPAQMIDKLNEFFGFTTEVVEIDSIGLVLDSIKGKNKIVKPSTSQQFLAVDAPTSYVSSANGKITRIEGELSAKDLAKHISADFSCPVEINKKIEDRQYRFDLEFSPATSDDERLAQFRNAGIILSKKIRKVEHLKIKR
jgi:hypothetical protein